MPHSLTSYNCNKDFLLVYLYNLFQVLHLDFVTVKDNDILFVTGVIIGILFFILLIYSYDIKHKQHLTAADFENKDKEKEEKERTLFEICSYQLDFNTDEKYMPNGYTPNNKPYTLFSDLIVVE